MILPALLFASAAVAQPVIQAVLNAASYSPNLAPGTWAVINGTGLAPAVEGLSVTVGGIAAPLLGVSPSQLIALIPYEVSGAVPLVVTTQEGLSDPFMLTLSRNAPGIYTQSGDGTGDALLSDTAGNPVSTIGADPIVLRATGLGPVSADPPNNATDPVQVFVGDQPADATFAGLVPGQPGIYQIIVTPRAPISNRLYLRVNGALSNIATLPIPVGLNVSNVTGSIDGLYPDTQSGGRPTSGPVSFSPMFIAGTMSGGFDISPDAKPFSVVARGGTGLAIAAASAQIDIDPAQKTWRATLTEPRPASRAYDFSNAGFVAMDFSTGRPFPNSVIPLSRVDPLALVASNRLPLPNLTPGVGANGIFTASGNLPPGGHFTLDDLRDILSFGGFTQIPSQGGLSLTASFQLFVDGLLIAAKDVDYPVL